MRIEAGPIHRRPEKGDQGQDADLFARVFDRIHASIAYLDRDFNFLRVNRNYAVLLQQVPEFFVGKNYFVLSPDRDVESIFRTVAQTGVAYCAHDQRLTFGAGEPNRPRYWDWCLEPVSDAGTGVAALVLSLVDVTQRTEAREKLGQSAARFKMLFDSASDGIFIHDRAGRLLEVNQVACRCLGYDRASLLSLPAGKIWREDYLAIVRHAAAERMARSAILETACRTSDGREIPVEINARYVMYDRTPAVLSIVRDISERKAQDERLRRSEASLAEAQHIARLGNWDWDIVANTLAWSDEIYRIFGLTPQQFGATYEAFLDAAHPEDRALITGAVNAALRGERDYSLDHRILLPDGSVRFVHEQAEVRRDGEGKALRMLGTVQDITEEKLHEMALRQTNRALKTLSLCNQVLVHATEEHALLRDMCEILVSWGGYRAAWVGYAEAAEADDARRVRPVVEMGLGAGQLATGGITWDDEGHHPAGAAIRLQTTQMMRDVLTDPGFASWRMEAMASGYRSLVALPLSAKERALGVLVICAAEPNAFDDEEVKLLRELADDMSYGVTTLRTRADHEQAVARWQRGMESTIQAVGSTVEIRDPYTAGHQRRVAELAAAIAHELGLPEDDIKAIRLTGMVHDIGKIYVPAEILNRPGTLSMIELTLVRAHAQVGYEILKDVEFAWPVAEMVRQHHERLDGSGYPRGLHGEEILRGARIVAVADVVEAMASHRPYRPGLGTEQALHEIEANRGRLYDAQVVDACLALFHDTRFRFADAGHA
jgi:PAS domain S-box-containing protein/putative nucleotidyltransferase with HDIG domain